MTSLQLKSVPDDVGVAGHLAVVTEEDDFLAVVDLADRQIISQWDVSKTFTPPANAPEDVCITHDQRYAVISFQKDSEKGKKKGNRLAIYRLPQMERLVDLPVDRTRPDLHLKNNLKEQGPGPEVIYVSERTDTLLVTLDLYGAVGLDGLVMRPPGQTCHLADAQHVSSSTLGLGLSRPRQSTYPGIREYFLVCNAGSEGGAALIDLARRTVVWRHKTPPGLETPVFFPELQQAFSVCSGKTKQRTATEVTKTFAPQQSLYRFDFSSPAALEKAAVEAIPLKAFTFQIALVSQRPPRLLIATGSTRGSCGTIGDLRPRFAEDAGRPTRCGTNRPLRSRLICRMLHTFEIRWFFPSSPLDAAQLFHDTKLLQSAHRLVRHALRPALRNQAPRRPTRSQAARRHARDPHPSRGQRASRILAEMESGLRARRISVAADCSNIPVGYRWKSSATCDILKSPKIRWLRSTRGPAMAVNSR